MSTDPSSEPKLIIDEDWKSQVQREKEELKKKELESEQAGSAAAMDSAAAEKQPSATASAEETSADQPPAPPPASLLLLITTLATQALAALGQLPDDSGESQPVNLDYARHFIDLIAVLEEKTKGNLSNEEQSYMQSTLHQMRLAFVAVRNQHL